MKINYLAVIAAAVAHFMIGGLWYGPIFGNKFIQLIAWSPEKLQQVSNESHAKELLIAFVTSLVMSYVLAHFVQYTKSRSFLEGMQTGFWLWLGFVATTQLSTVIFEERASGLYLLNIGYQLVGCLIAGGILAIWRLREAPPPAA